MTGQRPKEIALQHDPWLQNARPMYFPWAHHVSYRCVWVSISCRSKFCFFRWHNPAARQTRLLGFQPKGLELVYKHVPVQNNKFPPPCSASQGVSESQEPLALLQRLLEGTEKGALNLDSGNRTRGQKSGVSPLLFSFTKFSYGSLGRKITRIKA